MLCLQFFDVRQTRLHHKCSVLFHLWCSTPKILLVLLDILGFIVSCNLTVIHLINFISIPIVFKCIVNSWFCFVILTVWHCIAYIVLMCCYETAHSLTLSFVRVTYISVISYSHSETCNRSSGYGSCTASQSVWLQRHLLWSLSSRRHREITR